MVALPAGGDGIPAKLLQILKDDAVKVLHSICQQIWKTQQWPQDWKRSVFIPIPKKGNAKECANYRAIALISHASKVMLEILQARFQLHCRRPEFDPWVGKVIWRRKCQSTPVSLPGESHGQRTLVGYSPWGRKELDATELRD